MAKMWRETAEMLQKRSSKFMESMKVLQSCMKNQRNDDISPEAKKV